MRNHTWALIAASLFLSARAGAQVDLPDSARLAALARLKASATLRLQGPAIGIVEARLRSLSGDSIMLGRWRPERRVPLAAAESIWVLHSGVDQGAAAGALVVGLALGVLGGEFAMMGDNSDRSDKLRGFIAGAGIGAILGATLGAAVGAAHESWERVYPPF